MALTDEQKRQIVKFADVYLSRNDALHQMPHARKVYEHSLWLADAENGDKDICFASSMLHDIVKYQQVDHGTEGSKIAKRFLLEIELDKYVVESIRDAIYYHNKEFKDGSIERKILWDADKLGNMTKDGFAERMIPYYQLKNDKKTAIKKR